jgi:hypothetical protein
MLRVALIVVLASCTKVPVSSIELQKVELPGFTLQLPVGKPDTDAPPAAESSYVSGDVTRGQKSLVVVLVGWKLGALANPSTLAEIKRALGVDVDHPLALPANALATRSFRGQTRGAPSIFTEVICGARRFTILTVSQRVDVEELQRTILATVSCHPDPEQDKQFAGADLDRSIGWKGEPRIDLASRAGWKQLQNQKGLQLLMRDNGTTLMVMTFETEPSEADLKLLFRRDPIELGTGDPRPLHGTSAAGPIRGWQHALNCGADGWMVMTYLEADSELPPGGKDVVTGARCLDKGAPPVSWPGR